jgi:hypothetical protein
MAFLAPKSFPRISACEPIRNFCRYSNPALLEWRTRVMMTLDAYIRQENIFLYKKRLADRNITNDQRDMIRKLLAEEEAKLLSRQEPNGQGF